MDILGYDMTEKEIGVLDEIIADKQDAKDKVNEQVNKPVESTAEQPEETAPRLSPDEMKDISLWYTKALAWFKKGKGGAADWENKNSYRHKSALAINPHGVG